MIFMRALYCWFDGERFLRVSSQAGKRLIMPSHKVHCYWDRIHFGKSYRKIHEALDKPVWILGRRHRIIFHDGWSASEVAKKVCPGDPVAVEVAAAHVMLDEMCSNDRESKRELELLADLDAKGRKRSTKKRERARRRKLQGCLLRNRLRRWLNKCC